MLLAVYAQQQPEQEDLRCVAYEANGLKRNSVPDVSLLSALAFGAAGAGTSSPTAPPAASPICVCAEWLEFSADGALLAAVVRLGPPLDARVLLVYTFTNYEWHVKRCVALRTSSHPLFRVRWHAAAVAGPGPSAAAGALLHVLFQSHSPANERSRLRDGDKDAAAAGSADSDSASGVERSNSSIGCRYLALRVSTAPSLAGSAALVADGRYLRVTHLSLATVPPPLCHYTLDFAELQDRTDSRSARTSNSTSSPPALPDLMPLFAVSHIVVPSDHSVRSASASASASTAEPTCVLVVFANLHAALLSQTRALPKPSGTAPEATCECVELAPRSEQFPVALLESRGVRPFRFVHHYAPVVADDPELRAALPFANNFTFAFTCAPDRQQLELELQFQCCVPSARGSRICRAQYSHSERRWRLVQLCELDSPLECWAADYRRQTMKRRSVRANANEELISVAHVRDGRLLAIPSMSEQLSPSSTLRPPRACSAVWLTTLEVAAAEANGDADGVGAIGSSVASAASLDVSIAFASAHYTLYVGGQELATDCTGAALTPDAQFLLYVRSDESLLAGMSTLCALRLRGLSPDALAAVAHALRPAANAAGGKHLPGAAGAGCSLPEVLSRYTYKRPCERGSRLLQVFERLRNEQILPSTAVL